MQSQQWRPVIVDRARSGLTNTFESLGHWDAFPQLQGLATDMLMVAEQVMEVGLRGL